MVFKLLILGEGRDAAGKEDLKLANLGPLLVNANIFVCQDSGKDLAFHLICGCAWGAVKFWRKQTIGGFVFRSISLDLRI